MTRFALYVCLKKFFRDDHPIRGRRSARQPSSKLWLLPWHVPPVASMLHRDQAHEVTEPNVRTQSYTAKKRTISVVRRKRETAVSLGERRLLPFRDVIDRAESARRIEMLNRIAR